MLAYLWGWTWELFGRSGEGFNGLAALSYATVDAWARLTGNTPAPYEVEALMQLDAAIRNPDEGKKEAEVEALPAWPERKAPPVLIPND